MAEFSEAFLAGVGRVAVEWARVETEMKLHTSALAAQETDGYPLEDLEIGFKRMRRLWLAQIRKYRPAEIKEAEQICSDLAELAEQRAIILHGVWRSAGQRGRYSCGVIRQGRKGMLLTNAQPDASPRLLRNIADRIADAYVKLRTFTGPKHGNKHTYGFLV